MLALQLMVNGKLMATAGTAGVMSVACTVSAFGDDMCEVKPGVGPVVVHLGGLTYAPHTPANSASWLESLNCSVGDEITLRVLDTKDVDHPTVTPLSPGIEKSLVPRPSLLGRLMLCLSGNKRPAS